jgi:hypothetical protein
MHYNGLQRENYFTLVQIINNKETLNSQGSHSKLENLSLEQ